MRKHWMKLTLQAAPTALALVLAPMSSQAVEINNYILNFSAAGLAEGNSGLSDLANVDEWKTTSWSYVGFFDNDSSGGISAGDTFVDYIAVRVDQFQDLFANDITPGDYGADYELTAVARMSGVQVTNNSYIITNVDFFDLYFDAKDDLGADYTRTDFTDVAGTMVDGTHVESGTLLSGGGNNLGPVAPDGSIDIFLDLQDFLVTTSVGEYFELDEHGNPFPMEFLLGISDANNHIQTNDPPVSGIAGGLAGYFGFTPGTFSSPSFPGFLGGSDHNGNPFDFAFVTKSDGSFNKAVVPEPGTMILLGSGLVGLAGYGRRKSRKKDTA